MTEQRLQDWFDGKVLDEDLSDAEVLDLQSRVFDALHSKMLSKTSVTTFDVYETIQ